MYGGLVKPERNQVRIKGGFPDLSILFPDFLRTSVLLLQMALKSSALQSLGHLRP